MDGGSPIDTSRTIEDYDKKMTWLRLGNQESYFFCIRMNPITTFVSLFTIVLFIGFALGEDTKADFNEEMTEGVEWITETFTWLYIGSQNIWLVFLFYLAVTKYGDIKLGKQDSVPEYSNMSWFVMLFAAGIGVGFFFYGASEPLYHYDTGEYNRYFHQTELERAQDAINVTIFHWGIHGWIVYAIVAINLSVVVYRWDLPMTISSCFYPMLGDRVFGLFGNFIDVLSSITTLFGVCTSLGLGAKSLNAGLNRLDCGVDVKKEVQTMLIIVITATAIVSVSTGLDYGIKSLSWVCFALGNVICFSVLFLDDTWFLLDLMVQSTGYYFQYLVELGWWCDAFLRMDGGLGKLDVAPPSPSPSPLAVNATKLLADVALKAAAGLSNPSTQAAALNENLTPTIAYTNWMRWWTIFYWGWWISWSPFVGMFIAKISKGRTIRQFVIGTMAAPLGYTIFWFCTIGGAAIRMDRRANAAGLACGAPNATSSCCGGCYDTVIDSITKNATHAGLLRLSCGAGETNIYDLVGQPEYGMGDGSFLIVLTLFALALYFVTSSDSGSLIIDCMCSNGTEEPPLPQRVMWSIMEGACAIALMSGDGANGALKSLQNASIAAGLPYTIVICFMCIATWRAILHESGELKGRFWAQDLFTPAYFMVEGAIGVKSLVSLIIGIVAPPFLYFKISKALYEGDGAGVWSFVTTGLMTVFNLFFWILHIIAASDYDNQKTSGYWAIGWLCYCAMAGMFVVQRQHLRHKYNVVGNPFEDIFTALLALPACAGQMHDVLYNHDEPVKALPGYKQASSAVVSDEAVEAAQL